MVKPCSRRGGGGYLSVVLTEDDKGRLYREETVSFIGRPCRNFVEGELQEARRSAGI